MSESELFAEAERLFPYPLNACAFVRKKVNWQRENWVKERMRK